MNQLLPLQNPRDIGHYRIAGPVTFRRACKKFLSSKHDTPYINQGGNRQNIEKKMRVIWIADDGYTLGQVDQSGADALIVAHLVRAGKYRSLFQNGIKPHVYMALHLFAEQWKKRWKSREEIELALKTDIPDLPKLPFWKDLVKEIKSSDGWEPKERYYFLGKKVVHAFSYGMMGARLQQSVLGETYGAVVLERKQADELIEFAHREFPEIRLWHSAITAQVLSTRMLRNPFGHPLNVTWEVRADDMKDMYAWIPQNTVATITCTAMCDMYEYIEQNDKQWHILHETHDSILVEFPEPEALDGVRILSGFINQTMTAPDGTKFTMKSEAQLGKSWGEMQEVKL